MARLSMFTGGDSYRITRKAFPRHTAVSQCRPPQGTLSGEAERTGLPPSLCCSSRDRSPPIFLVAALAVFRSSASAREVLMS